MASNVSNLNGNKSSNALVITDASGVPYASTVGINSDANSQNTFVKIPGEDLYYLFTIGTDAKPYYHIISPTSKSVLQKNMPVDKLSGYSFSMAVIMDEAGLGSSKLFLKQYQNDSTSLYAFNFDNSGITGKRLIDKVPSNDKAAVSAMVLSNDASQLAVVVDKSKPRFLFRSPKNCELRIYDINSSYDSIVLSDSLVFNQNYISSLAYSQNNTYLYYQKQDMQGNAALHRYNLNSQSSEAITAVTAQGKLRYADSLLYIMHDSKIEILAHTDTTLANIEKSTLNAAASFRYSGLSSSSTIGMHGSFTYGYDGNTYYRCLAKQYELKDHLGNVRVVISDVKKPTDANFNQFTADLQAYYNYYAFGMLQPNRHYTLAEEYKFGYQGSEMDNEINGATGSMYTTFYRLLDTRIVQWKTPDPKSYLTPWESPYCSMGNNPIWYTDILGDKFKTPKDEKKANRVEKTAKVRRKQLRQKLTYLKQTEQPTLEQQNQIANLEQSIEELSSSIFEIGVLRESENIYTFNKRREGGGNVNIDEFGVLTINYNSFHDMVHELKHAYQFETGEISFGKDGKGGILYDKMDEVEAYKRGFAFGDRDHFNNMSSITMENVGILLNSKSNRPYLNLPNTQLTYQSTISDYNKAVSLKYKITDAPSSSSLSEYERNYYSKTTMAKMNPFRNSYLLHKRN
jgi:hypothetical protein